MSEDQFSSILVPRCLTCGALKPRSEFHKDKKRPFGCAAKCKACKREYDAHYRDENRERVRENSRRYQREHKDDKREYDKQYRAENAERIAEVSRAYREINKEHKQEYDRQRRETHRERNKANHKKWRDANPDRLAEYRINDRAKHPERNRQDVRKRRALKESAPGDGATLSELIAMYGPLCYLCKKAPATLVEHMIPLSRGGDNWKSNLRPSCHPCNVSKANKTYEEYMDYLSH